MSRRRNLAGYVPNRSRRLPGVILDIGLRGRLLHVVKVVIVTARPSHPTPALEVMYGRYLHSGTHSVYLTRRITKVSAFALFPRHACRPGQ